MGGPMQLKGFKWWESFLIEKMFFQQRMVAMFGLKRMQEVMASNEPFIMPLIYYQHSFDIYIFILI